MTAVRTAVEVGGRSRRDQSDAPAGRPRTPNVPAWSRGVAGAVLTGRSRRPRAGVRRVTALGSRGPRRWGTPRAGVGRAVAEVGEDLVDLRCLGDARDDPHRAAAGGTCERVDLDEPLEQRLPTGGWPRSAPAMVREQSREARPLPRAPPSPACRAGVVGKPTARWPPHRDARTESQAPAGFSVRRPVASGISKRLYRHISQDVCPWNRKFSQALADDSPFRARAFIAGKDAVTLATEILALDQAQFSAAFRKSPMKRAKLHGLQRNAAVVLGNTVIPEE